MNNELFIISRLLFFVIAIMLNNNTRCFVLKTTKGTNLNGSLEKSDLICRSFWCVPYNSVHLERQLTPQSKIYFRKLL